MANFQFPAFFLKTLVVESNWCLQFLVVSCVPHQLELDWWLCWLVSQFWFYVSLPFMPAAGWCYSMTKFSMCLLCVFIHESVDTAGSNGKSSVQFPLCWVNSWALVDVTIKVLKHKQSEFFWHNVCLSRAWRASSNISNQWYAHCQGVGCFNMECWQFGSDVVVTGTR